MKTKALSLSLILIVFLAADLNAQVGGSLHNEGSGASIIQENNASNPCITSHEYDLVEQRCNENLKTIGFQKPELNHVAAAATSLSWPLKAAPSLKDCSYYHITAYVDQNTASGSFKDFNCGTNTYDSHRGTDISIGPFNFVKMDNNLVEVVAAASGTILDKHDGEFDRNCATNSLTANYIVIQHTDGSRAMYWHMKKNSLTTKTIGQSVTVGEKLGIVGSSGNSSGAHLHFEVWSGSTVATFIDPYSGACNTLNSSSWWAAQKPYKETGVMKVSANTTDVVLSPCPTEIPNEATYFVVPFQGASLPAGYAKFYMYIRDEVNGTTADLSILNPDATTYLNWTYSSTTNSKLLYWGFTKKLPTTIGKYTFKATYNGVTCSSTFDVLDKVGIQEQIDTKRVNIYPNPSNGKFFLEIESSPDMTFEVYDLLGKRIYFNDQLSNKSEINLQVEPGIYLYQIVQNMQIIHSGKITIGS